MKAPIRFLAMLLGSLFVIAGSGQAFACTFCAPPADTMNVAVSANSIGTNTTATVTVTVTRHNGAPETDGTVISATVSPPTLGTIAGVGASGSASGSSSPLVGGMASFVFVANNATGTATVTISVPPANGYPNTIIKQVPITIAQGSGNNPSLMLTDVSQSDPTQVTLPQNLIGVGPYFGSPYMAELKVEWRGLITGQALNGKVNVSIAPVQVAAFSTLDDPTTPWTGETKTPQTAEGNEFLTELGSGTVNVVAGVGTIFVHSGAALGTTTLSVSALDPETNRTISSQINVTVITPPGANLPTTLSLSQASGGLYVNGSNGPQSKVITATVTNIYGTPAIAAPGANNVQFDIVGPSGTDAQLFNPFAVGTLPGSTAKAATGGGGASVYLMAGKVEGPVQIRATVDMLDGNVDNGVTIPLMATTTVPISDGRLYNLTLTSPMVNAIAVNGITPSGGSSSTVNGVTLPLQPDATYSLTVSAIATDRGGNPVLPGTEITFGLIDGPQDPDFAVTCNGLAAFQICGSQGNPQPGGLYFSSPDGQFKTRGGGAGPGDTLVVFGKQEHGAPAGNDDLESALPISQIYSGTQLFTQFPFNRNDTTGTSMLPGPLPYVIGRATIGSNINSPVATDSSGAATITGTATTKLNYPVSKLNRGVVIWAQGTGPDTAYLDASGKPTTRLVTDAIVTTYPAVADLIVSASPNPIPGNGTVSVNVCVTDALQVPIPNLHFNFSFSNLGAGSGTVDGNSSGWTQYATGSSGCVVATVYTNGIASSSGGSSSSGTPTLTFTAPGYAAGSSASVAIPITAGGNLVLLASPSALGGLGGPVTLTLRTSNGQPVPGVQLTGTCTGDTVSLDSGPGVTGTDGKTGASISADLNGYGSAGSGTCTFTTASGSPTATVNLKGADICKTLPDPSTEPKCNTSTGSTTSNKLTLIVDSTQADAATSPNAITDTVTATLGGGSQFSPGGSGVFTCSTAAHTTNTCAKGVPGTITSVTIKATAGTGSITPGTGDKFKQWDIDCSSSAGFFAASTTIPISGDTTCTAHFTTGP